MTTPPSESNNFIFWIAIWGAVLSTIAILVRIADYLQDRRSLKVNAYAACEGTLGVGITQEDALALIITNRSRRPIYVESVGATWEKEGKKRQALLLFPNIPYTVTESKPYRQVFNVLEEVEVTSLKSIFVIDSLSKKWRVPRKSIKRLREKRFET